jgi:hypothetical protein
MVRRAARTAFFLPLLLAALLLPGCRFFMASFFPGYLAQVEKSYDMGGKIDAFLSILGSVGYPWHPTVFVLTSGTGADYGGLLIEVEGRTERLLLMADPSGGVQQLPSPYLSQINFTNSYGNFVVGRLYFPPGYLSSYLDSGIAMDGRAFSTGSANYRLWTNSSESNLVYWQTLDPSSMPWSAGSPNPLTIGDSGFELRGVYYDPLAAGNPLALVLFNYNYNQVYLFRTPAPPSAATSLSVDYPPLTFQDTDASNVIYTRKGVVVAQDREALLMDFNGGETGKRLTLGQGGDKRLGFDIEGDVFYVFDPESRMLYRGKTGW